MRDIQEASEESEQSGSDLDDDTANVKFSEEDEISASEWGGMGGSIADDEEVPTLLPAPSEESVPGKYCFTSLCLASY